MPSPPPLDALQQRLGHTFRNPALLISALTHPSCLPDRPGAPAHNQRLEFLGDAVLLFLLTDALYREYPDDREGLLSRRRAMLANGTFLAGLARDLGLDTSLILGASEEAAGGRLRPSILEDACEAVVGALFLDSDLPTTRRVVLAWYGDLRARLAALEDAENPKGRLQELVQPLHGNTALHYELIAASGPDHARHYSVQVRLGERLLATGQGSSKKTAEEAAARAALAAWPAQPAATSLPG